MDFRSEVLDLYRKYEYAIKERDQLRLSSFFSFPLEIQLSQGIKREFRSQAEVLASTEAFYSACAFAGIVKTVGKAQKLHLTSDREALLFSRARAYDKSGVQIATWRTSFFITAAVGKPDMIAKIDATELSNVMSEFGFPLQEAKLVSVN